MSLESEMEELDTSAVAAARIKSDCWRALEVHFSKTCQRQMRDQFASEPQRFAAFSIRFNDILFDYSKNRIDQDTMALLVNLAESAGVSAMIQKMFRGEKINHTENRPVLHTALRNFAGEPIEVDGIDIMPEVEQERSRVYQLAHAVRSGNWQGATGKRITDVVNIGIGGSYLGPLMVTEALKPFVSADIKMHFVANLDENDILDTLQDLQAETTLFIISSKTFTTQETMLNAHTARKWFLAQHPDEQDLAKHFVAVSENRQAAMAFGIQADNIFKMWDWVGGRYSLWSAIGLSIVIAIGEENFQQLLSGAYEVDEHFQQAELAKNIPVVMALIGIWYNNFYRAETIAILPYAHHLHRFPAYLQQADMESNGKSVDDEGHTINYSTGPILFGDMGNPSQHAFYQLLHQGTKLVPVDFLLPMQNINGASEHHDALVSNALAQAEALMKGKNEREVYAELAETGLNEAAIAELLPHKIFPGNRPSNMFVFDALTPKTLGSLIAFYEHKIFVQGVIWNINSFDQWGVELGKSLANKILSEINTGDTTARHDSSTAALLAHYLSHKP